MFWRAAEAAATVQAARILRRVQDQAIPRQACVVTRARMARTWRHTSAQNPTGISKTTGLPKVTRIRIQARKERVNRPRSDPKEGTWVYFETYCSLCLFLCQGSHWRTA